MTQLTDGSFLYSMEDLPWYHFHETPDEKMKIVHIDENAQQVVFVQRFGVNSRHARHTHHCTAVAYTLSGTWLYDGAEIRTGKLAFEPFGSTHSPSTSEGNVADVLVILTATEKDGRLLELHGDDGSSFELNIELFKTMASMTPDEFLAYQRSFFQSV